MKPATLKIFGIAIIAALASVSAIAQFDDVYYDPDAYDTYESSSYYSDDDDYNRNYEDSYYDNDEYSHFDDYDYYYSSRIRRFHRPYRGFDFYSPAYVDLYYYDPFAFSYNYWYPGTSIYISFGSPWNRWNRWNRWNHWGSPVHRYYSYNYYNHWYRPTWGWYDYGYYGYNSYNHYGYNSYNYYYGGGCPMPVANVYNPGGGSNWGNPNGTHYGPRTTGTVKSSPRGLNEINSVRDVNKSGGHKDAVADPSHNGVKRDVENPNISKRPAGTDDRETVRSRETERYVPATRPGDNNTVKRTDPRATDRQRQPATREEPVQRSPKPAYDRTPTQRPTPPRQTERYTPPKRDNSPSRNYQSVPDRSDRKTYQTPSRSSDQRRQSRSYNTDRPSRSYNSGNSGQSSRRSYNSGSNNRSNSSSNRSYNSGSSRSSSGSSKSYNSGSSSRSSSGGGRTPSRSGRGG